MRFGIEEPPRKGGDIPAVLDAVKLLTDIAPVTIGRCVALRP